jgi:hypothetical protein
LRKPGKGGYGGGVVGNPYHDGKSGKFTSKPGGAKAVKAPAAKKPSTSTKSGGAGAASKVDASDGKLNPEQYDTLKPTGGAYSNARRDAAIAQLESTPQGKLLSKYADDFQHQPSDQFRNEIAAVATTGKYQTKAGTERAKAFLRASRDVPRDILPDKLYRGHTMAGKDRNGVEITPQSVAAGYRRAGKTTLNVSSFTSNPKIAREYTTYHAGAQGANNKDFVRVMTTVKVGEKAQMLPIENISRGPDTHRDREYLGLGEYKVNSVRVKGNEVHVEIEQTGLIVPKEDRG